MEFICGLSGLTLALMCPDSYSAAEAVLLKRPCRSAFGVTRASSTFRALLLRPLGALGSEASMLCGGREGCQYNPHVSLCHWDLHARHFCCWCRCCGRWTALHFTQCTAVMFVCLFVVSTVADCWRQESGKTWCCAARCYAICACSRQIDLSCWLNMCSFCFTLLACCRP